jgi:hypothetical protein
MRVYGMTYQQVMEVPIKAFWTLSGNVPRLYASERADTFELLVQAQGDDVEHIRTVMKSLRDQAPDPIVLTGTAVAKVTATRDQDGFEELRSMALLS